MTTPDHAPAARLRSALTPIASVALAVLPIVVAAVRAAAGRWVPIGDDAYFTVRALDVGTEHHPLVGAWSSGSLDIDRLVNNLGPIQIDLLVPFVRVAPMGGTAIGVAAVQAACVVTIAWLVDRIAGATSVLPAMAAVSVMTWTLGSEMLITSRQHQFLLLTYLCFLVAAWAATVGDRWATVPVVATGSLLTQTHLSYPILVAVVGVPVLVGQVVAARRDWRAYRSPWIVAVVLALVLWSQTVIDQVVGWGNLSAVLSSSGTADSPGFATGLRLIADVLLAPRGYLRPGFARFDPQGDLASWAHTMLLVVVWGLIVTAAVVSWRAGRRVATGGLAVAASALVASWIDAAQLPITVFGRTGANYRWLWPTATLLLLGALVAARRHLPRRLLGETSVADRAADAAIGLVLLAFVLANLPRSVQVVDPARYDSQVAIAAEMVDQLRDVDLVGPVVIDQSQMYFGHPYTYPVAVVLLERGLDFRLVDDMQRRRFGDGRVADGTEPTRLVLWHGDTADALAGGSDTVVYVGGPDPLAITRETR